MRKVVIPVFTEEEETKAQGGEAVMAFVNLWGIGLCMAYKLYFMLGTLFVSDCKLHFEYGACLPFASMLTTPLGDDGINSCT